MVVLLQSPVPESIWHPSIQKKCLHGRLQTSDRYINMKYPQVSVTTVQQIDAHWLKYVIGSTLQYNRMLTSYYTAKK